MCVRQIYAWARTRLSWACKDGGIQRNCARRNCLDSIVPETALFPMVWHGFVGSAETVQAGGIRNRATSERNALQLPELRFRQPSWGAGTA